MNKPKLQLDLWASWAGLIIGAGVVMVSETMRLNRSHFGYACILACVFYLWNRKVFLNASDRKPRLHMQNSSRQILFVALIFVILLLISGIILRSSLYIRSLAYLILFGLLVILLVLQISLFNCDEVLNQYVLLGQIFLLIVSSKAGAYFLYPTVSGNDSFYHQRLLEQLIDTGIIPTGAYHSFPAMHLLAAAFSLISGLSSGIGIYYIGLLHSIFLLSVFSVGKAFFDARSGLLAVLILGLSDYQIIWGVQITPMTLGIALFMLILLAIYKRKIALSSRERLIWTILILMFSGMIIFTHTLATMILLAGLSCLMLVSSILRNKSDHSRMVSLGLCVLVGVAMLYYWMQSVMLADSNFFVTLVHSVQFALTTAELGNTDMVSYASKLNNGAVFLGEAGWTFTLMGAFIGALMTLSRKYIQPERLSISILMGAFLFVAYGGGVLGLASVLPARWVTYLTIPAALLCANAIRSIFSIQSGKLFNGLAMTLVILGVSLTITTPTRFLPDSPLYETELSVRPGFYESELAGLGFANDRAFGSMATSGRSRLIVTKAKLIDPTLPDTYTEIDLIGLRSFDFTHGFFIPFPRDQVNKYVLPPVEFIEYLTGVSRWRIYDDGSVQLYLRATQ